MTGRLQDKDCTRYLIIRAPMISTLHLKGNALLLFALITGYSRKEGAGFYGSFTTMARTVGASRTAVIRAIQQLEDGGLIDCRPVMDGNIRRNLYTSNYERFVE